MTVDPPGIFVPAPGICRETVSPVPMVRQFRVFSDRAAFASVTVLPVTSGTDTSTAADSAELYTFSTPI